MKIREMRENEDIDDYFRIFEMTAKAQSLPKEEWVGNLVPKLTEKATSIYLEIPDPACQDYEEKQRHSATNNCAVPSARNRNSFR